MNRFRYDVSGGYAADCFNVQIVRIVYRSFEMKAFGKTLEIRGGQTKADDRTGGEGESVTIISGDPSPANKASIPDCRRMAGACIRYLLVVKISVWIRQNGLHLILIITIIINVINCVVYCSRFCMNHVELHLYGEVRQFVAFPSFLESVILRIFA